MRSRPCTAWGSKGGANESGLTVNALATISRAEAMTILGRTQAKGYAEPELTFSDAGQVPDWAAGYLRSLVGQALSPATTTASAPTIG